MKIKNHCKVDIKGLEMEKALEKIVEAKENMNIGYIEWANDCIDEAISELEEDMKPKTCDGCKWEQETKIIKTSIGDRIDICKLCNRYEKLQDYFDPKDNA